jgi:hypothetical protein
MRPRRCCDRDVDIGSARFRELARVDSGGVVDITGVVNVASDQDGDRAD